MTIKEIEANLETCRGMSRNEYRAEMKKIEAQLARDGYTHTHTAMTGDVETCGCYYSNEQGDQCRMVGSLVIAIN